MLRAVAAFEFRQQLKNPAFAVSAILFFLLTFLAACIDQVQIGASAAVHANSPYAVVIIALTMVFFFMFASTALVASAVVRDDETGYGPLIRATRITKAHYVYGRFLGAFGVAALAFLAVPLGTLVGAAMPWVDPSRIGPVRLLDYLYAYAVLGLPGVLLTSAGFYALALATRSMLGAYLGVVAVLILYVVVTTIGSRPEYMTLMAYADPIGLGAIDLATRYWTIAQKNSALPPLAGPLLLNRLLWTGLAVAILACCSRIYRFNEPVRRGTAARPPEPSRAPAPPAPAGPVRATRAASSGPAALFLVQLAARTRVDLAQVFKSPAFLVLLALGVVNSFAGLWFGSASHGVGIYPLTRVMITTLRGAFSLVPVIVAIYYAGELVWRDRERRAAEVIDATPVPDAVFVLPKLFAMALVFLVLFLASVLTALAVQAAKGFDDFELQKYLVWWVAPMTASLTIFSALCLFVQVLAPHKFVGWAVMLVVIVLNLVMSQLGLEHELYRFGGGLIGPQPELSDMNGLGAADTGALWIRAYWGFIAAALLALSWALWRRGPDPRLRPRLARLGRRLSGPIGGFLAVSLLGAGVAGGVIFFNEDILNVYRTGLDDDHWRAAYERRFLRFERLPQPKITDIVLDVDLHPRALTAQTSGTYRFVNRTGGPIGELHVRFPRDLAEATDAVEGARLERRFPEFGYEIFRFDRPLAPGAEGRLSFRTRLAQVGFAHHRAVAGLQPNGVFLNDTEITPQIGMDRDVLLTDPSKRRRAGLPPQLRVPPLEDRSAQAFNLLRRDADFVTSDITVRTDPDQTPIAPGDRVEDRVLGGRRIARFRAPSPILPFFSVQSARYAEARGRSGAVALSVRSHPAHGWNVDRMMEALKTGLGYDQAAFSPYQFHEVRILEFPAPIGTFAQSFAGTIPYSEDAGFVFDVRDRSKVDMVSYVTAHELGHQWWAHQVIGARMQGATFLDETLAQYSALMAMERLYGKDQIRRFLKYELDDYLRRRGGETLEEEPLERVENQAYVHYEKGALVMYRLKEVLGEDKVNGALKAFLGAYAFRGPPYPRSVDLIDRFRAAAGPDPHMQALIGDLFERITLYDLKAKSATAERMTDGRYRVRLLIEASKVYADGAGRERPAPLDEPVDVGLFRAKPGDARYSQKDVIAISRRRLVSGGTLVEFTSKDLPAWAGVDPYNTMITRNSDTNLVKVTQAIKSGS